MSEATDYGYPCNCPVCGLPVKAWDYGEPMGWHIATHQGPDGEACCSDFTNESKMPAPMGYAIARLIALEELLQ